MVHWPRLLSLLALLFSLMVTGVCADDEVSDLWDIAPPLTDSPRSTIVSLLDEVEHELTDTPDFPPHGSVTREDRQD